MMKIIVFILLATGLLQGCASKKKLMATGGNSTADIKKVDESVLKQDEGLAIWQLTSNDEVAITIQKVGKEKTETFLVKEGISKIVLQAGRWQIAGFQLPDETYVSLKLGPKFDFRLKKNTVTYAGSIIIQCPKVGPEHFSVLKKMSFFNRYHFSSDSKLCEMVVGDNFTEVKQTWQELGNWSKKKLIIGF